MRTILKLKIFLPIIFLFEINFSNAQGPLPCGPSNINKAALKAALQYEQSTPPTIPNYTMRVFFHICACDNGTVPAATPTQLDSEFNTLVKSYYTNGICFLNCGFNYVYSTKLDTNFVVGTDNQNLFDSYRVSGCIDIFYMKKIKGTNTACNGSCGYGGYSFNIPGTICLVGTGNINKGQTVSHEVGHCLGLLHTFEPANGYEDIDGSNSSTAADLITDTGADPYAYNALPCYSTSGCVYNGTCTDPKGKSNFVPPYYNLMSYWWSVGCYTGLSLSSNQFIRVNSFLSTNSSLQACESGAEATEGPNLSISTGYNMISAKDVLTTTGTVTISGNAFVVFGGQTVLLEPGFDAVPSNGFFNAKIQECSPLFREEEASEEVLQENSLTAYPNPSAGEMNLAITLNEEESNASLEVYDMNLKRVNEIDFGNLHSGIQTEQMNLQSLPSGIYFLVLKTSSSKLETKIVLER